MGVNRLGDKHASIGWRCPHARGGEPSSNNGDWTPLRVVPTLVGVNRNLYKKSLLNAHVVPTLVGVNRRKADFTIRPAHVVPTLVGVNQGAAASCRAGLTVVPTLVGVNLVDIQQPLQAEVLSPRSWG